MSGSHRYWPAIAVTGLFVGGSLSAQEDTTSAFDRIPWQHGPVTGDLGAEAEVKVPEGCVFTGADGSRQFIELTQNIPSGGERGVVVCDLQSAESREPWFVIFTYDASGYVKDKDHDKLDADAILTALTKGTEEGNKTRLARGWEALTIAGWMRPPYYDEATHNLTWATKVRGDSGAESVNHSVRLLGRAGVMHVDLVTNPAQFDAIIGTFDDVVAGFTFRAGNLYSEWRSGDKVASYGLTALIAGGAGVLAVKTGLLAKFWKFIVAGVAGVAAWLKKIFGGKKAAKPESTNA